MDIDLDDISQYPPSVYDLYVEKKKYDAHIKRKDEKITKVEDQFHDFLEKRASDTMKKREKRGLQVRKRPSPLEQIKDFKDL